MEEKKTKQDKPEKPETLPPEVRANMLSTEKSIFFNVALFEQAQRVAKLFADSTMVPTQFRGNIGNCMIALNYASRIQADAFMVFQCLYEIHGRPGIEGKLVEAIINASNKYSEPLQYEWLDPEDKIVARHIVLNHKAFEAFGCQAFSIDAKSQKRVDGPKITWELVHAEGWDEDKKNRTTGAIIKSKWKTMPEMMFYYRAASWFGNKNCPELKLGMHTVEELEDIVELTPGQNGAYGTPDAVAALNEKIKQPASTDEQKTDIYEAQELKPESEEKTESGLDEGKKTPEYSPLVQQFIKLRKGDGVKTGLGPAILKNKAAIQAASPEDQEIIKGKFYTLYGANVSYPFDPPAGKETEEKPDRMIENQEKILELVKGAEITEVLNAPATVVDCPNKDHKPTVKWCNSGNCKVREGCDSWKDYDAWKLG